MSKSHVGLCYLASPYSHPDPMVRQQRADATCRAAAELIRQGKVVFSPIAHSDTLCRYGLPLDWGFWQHIDRRFLEACDEVAVLLLAGWQDSVGVKEELAIARELGKPVTFIAAGGQAKEGHRDARV